MQLQFDIVVIVIVHSDITPAPLSPSQVTLQRNAGFPPSFCAHAKRLSWLVCAAQGFIRQPSRDIVLQSRDPKELIDLLENYSPPSSIIKLALEGKLLHNLRG